MDLGICSHCYWWQWRLKKSLNIYLGIFTINFSFLESKLSQDIDEMCCLGKIYHWEMWPKKVNK